MHSQTTFPIAATSSTLRDPEVRALLASTQPGAVTFYPVNAVIHAQGDATGPLYLVEFGTVRIYQMTPDGRRQIISFCFAGDVFGFEPGDEHQFYAESVDGAGIRVLRPNGEVGFAGHLLRLALRRFARMQAHLVLLGRMGATEKLAHFLLEMMERQVSEDIVNLPMQRNDIADYLGLTFETVSRALRVLKDRAIIRLQSVECIEVLDVDALSSLSE